MSGDENLGDETDVRHVGLQAAAQPITLERTDAKPAITLSDHLLQALIFVLSVSAAQLVSSTGDLHRWGFVLGLLSSPFWIICSLRARQWGIFFLSIFYCGAWYQGIANRFL